MASASYARSNPDHRTLPRLRPIKTEMRLSLRSSFLTLATASLSFDSSPFSTSMLLRLDDLSSEDRPSLSVDGFLVVLVLGLSGTSLGGVMGGRAEMMLLPAELEPLCMVCGCSCGGGGGVDAVEEDACACMDCEDARRKKGMADGVRRFPDGGLALFADKAEVVLLLALDPVSERLGTRSGVRERTDLTDGAGCGDCLCMDVRGDASLRSIGVHDSDSLGDCGSTGVQFSESFEDAGFSLASEVRGAMKLCLLARGDSGDFGGCSPCLSLLSFSDDECSLRFSALEKLHFFVGVL